MLNILAHIVPYAPTSSSPARVLERLGLSGAKALVAALSSVSPRKVAEEAAGQEAYLVGRL